MSECNPVQLENISRTQHGVSQVGKKAKAKAVPRLCEVRSGQLFPHLRRKAEGRKWMPTTAAGTVIRPGKGHPDWRTWLAVLTVEQGEETLLGTE